MRTFAYGFLLAFGINMAILFSNFLFEGLAMLLVFTIPVEFFVGFLLLFFKRYSPFGGGLVVASGVSLLVTGFVCSSVSFR